MARGLTGENGLLTGLVRRVLQTGLEVEMTEHLGYERHAVEGTGSPNSRNGFTPKRVTTEIGEGRPGGAPGPCGHVRACDGGASTGAVWTACRAT